MASTTLTRLPRALSNRLPTLIASRSTTAATLTHHSTFSTTLRPASAWSKGPAPPRLPKEEQELFEKLQKASAIGGAFSQPTTNINPAQPEAQAATPPSSTSPDFSSLRARINQSPQSSSSTPAAMTQKHGESDLEFKARVDADGDGEELHPNIRRGAKPEFEGETNPKTGEVGGPKNEPLRWGGAGDWSYNGRVTDF